MSPIDWQSTNQDTAELMLLPRGDGLHARVPTRFLPRNSAFCAASPSCCIDCSAKPTLSMVLLHIQEGVIAKRCLSRSVAIVKTDAADVRLAATK